MLTISVVALALLVGATVALADTYWSGTGYGTCDFGGAIAHPWANWQGTWTSRNIFYGSWWTGGGGPSGTFYGVVSYTGDNNCPYQAVGTWTVTDLYYPAGYFWMCFKNDTCWGYWNADSTEYDCEGTMAGHKL